MGVLDALSGINEGVKNASDAVLDNENLSVQDKARGAAMWATGYGEGDEAEFARDAQQQYQQTEDAVTDPIGNAVKGLPGGDLAIGAGRGAESVVELFAGSPAKIAYSTATGVDVTTENPEAATTEYEPGALDVAELGLIATGPVGRGASAAAKTGAKAAARTGGGKSVGILGNTARRILGASDEAADAKSAARAGDTKTSVDMDPRFKSLDDSQPEGLTVPDELTGGGTAATKLDDAAAAGGNTASSGGLSFNQKILGGSLAAGLGLGAAGVIGGPDAYPDGYRVDKRYADGPGVRIRTTDGDGNTIGYWVAVGETGEELSILGSNGRSTRTVTFPADNPTFDSAQQADNAYGVWLRENRNDSDAAPNGNDNSDNRPEQAWEQPDVVVSLGQGWYLARQGHKTEDRARFYVVGKTGDGTLVYLASGGAAVQSPSPFSSEAEATQAYQSWSQRAQSGDAAVVPDPALDRPDGGDIPAPENGGGVLGGMGVVAIGGAALAAAALLYMVILR